MGGNVTHIFDSLGVTTVHTRDREPKKNKGSLSADGARLIHIIEALLKVSSVVNMVGPDTHVDSDALVDNGDLNHDLVEALAHSRRRAEQICGLSRDEFGLFNDEVGSWPSKEVGQSWIKPTR